MGVVRTPGGRGVGPVRRRECRARRRGQREIEMEGVGRVETGRERVR